LWASTFAVCAAAGLLAAFGFDCATASLASSNSEQNTMKTTDKTGLRFIFISPAIFADHFFI
jgi:hypothetical protein